MQLAVAIVTTTIGENVVCKQCSSIFRCNGIFNKTTVHTCFRGSRSGTVSMTKCKPAVAFCATVTISTATFSTSATTVFLSKQILQLRALFYLMHTKHKKL